MDIPLLDARDFSKQKVLVRVDFNVPLEKNGTITDTLRISASLPTLQMILKQGGSLILLSHLGRPKGEKNLKYSLKPCQKVLSELLGQEVLFAKDCLGEETAHQIKQLKSSEVILLENLRFYAAEENPSLDPLFAKTIASYGDFYVNDAFSVCHRSHASITSLPSFFPKKCAAGLLLQKEIETLSPLFSSPLKPFHAIIGGSKVSSKLGIIKTFLEKADTLYIGGAMAFTFFKAMGLSIGSSLFEPDLIKTAKNILDECKQKNIKLMLPQDIVAASSLSNNALKKVIDISQDPINPSWLGVDLGPKTINEWCQSLQKASSVFWNGPVGVFEIPAFSEGTFSLARFLANLSSSRIIGGGDSAAAVGQLNLNKKFTFISTGGGASLEFIQQGTLPGIEALRAKK